MIYPSGACNSASEGSLCAVFGRRRGGRKIYYFGEVGQDGDRLREGPAESLGGDELWFFGGVVTEAEAASPVLGVWVGPCAVFGWIV